MVEERLEVLVGPWLVEDDEIGEEQCRLMTETIGTSTSRGGGSVERRARWNAPLYSGRRITPQPQQIYGLGKTMLVDLAEIAGDVTEQTIDHRYELPQGRREKFYDRE